MLAGELQVAFIKSACRRIVFMFCNRIFLFNNLHAAHHLRGGLPWYRIPTFYRLNRAALIEHNGGLVYNSYLEVARRYLLKPHDSPLHPEWGRLEA